MGTIISARSSWDNPKVAAEVAAIVCKTLERWLYTTPFGFPVVPLV